MPLVVKRAGSDEYGTWVKILIAGDSGAGKTLISSTFPEVLYANAEGGLMSVADRQPAYVDINSLDDLLKLHQVLSQEPRVREGMLGTPVSTIVIDTMDVVQKILAAERLRNEHKETMAIADWGWLGEQTRLIVRSYRNLDMNCVFNIHIKTVEDSETGQTFVKPGLQGAMMDEISAWVDLAVLLKAQPATVVVNGKQVRRVSRVMQTSPDVRHPWLKDRSGKLPMEFEVNFVDDYARMHALIFPSKTAPKSQVIMADIGAPGKPSAVPTASPVTMVPTPAPTASKPTFTAPPSLEPPRRGRPPGSTNKPKPPPEQPVKRAGPLPTAPPLPAPAPLPAPPPLPAPEVTEDVSLPAGQVSSEPTFTVAETIPEPVKAEMSEPTEPCVECGTSVTGDMLDLSKLRARKPLCRTCYVAWRK